MRLPSRRCQYSMNSAIDLPVGIAAALPWLGCALVEAGAEGGAGAGQDDDADRAVGVGLIEGAVQLGLKIGESAFMRVRPVERDGRDLVFDAVDDFRLAHANNSVPSWSLWIDVT